MNVEHFGYIFAAYAIAVVVVAGMIASIMIEHRSLKAALEKFAAREGEDS